MKVIITVIREVTYSSIVQMTNAKFKHLDAMLDSGDRIERNRAEIELNKLIDIRDWQNDEFKSIEEFEKDDKTK
jgi:hypothetical protein